ncbi:MAG: rod shape-determining protein MreC [Candidatus Nitrospinota bacterium M3_3B_026]
MNGFFKKRRDLAILLVLTAASFSLLLVNLREESSLSVLEKVVIAAVAPFQEAVSWTVSRTAAVWEDYVYLVNLRQENKDLKSKVDRLTFENSLLVERLKSYQRLDRLLTFPRLDTAVFEAARVIGRDTTDRMKVIIINKGSNHGIGEDMPVVTSRGLVGRVAGVSWRASKVLLITDVRSAIDAIAQDSREGMVIVGTNSPLLEARYLDVMADVKEGDKVISSGLGGVFPKGMLIGALTDVRRKRGALFLSARVAPFVDLNGLEEVLVIKGMKEPEGGAAR